MARRCSSSNLASGTKIRMGFSANGICCWLRTTAVRPVLRVFLLRTKACGLCYVFFCFARRPAACATCFSASHEGLRPVLRGRRPKASWVDGTLALWRRLRGCGRRAGWASPIGRCAEGTVAAGHRIEAQFGAHFVDRLDAGPDVIDRDGSDLRGIARRVVAPDEFEIGGRELPRDDAVAELLHPGLQGQQAFGERRILRGLGGGAVDLGDEGLRRDREGEADDARQPYVERVLERRLARRNEGLGDAARHELGVAARRG